LKSIDSTIEKRQIFMETRVLEKNKIEADLNIIEDKIKLSQKTLGKADIKIHALNDERALLEALLKRASHDILACEKAIKAGIKNKATLKRLEQVNPSKPILDVAGKVLAGTRINGRSAHLTLTRTLSRTRIMEITNQPDKGSKKRSEMVIANL
ncbi:MAG: hypothetical protein WC836_21515, partial [Desulfobacula sp.]